MTDRFVDFDAARAERRVEPVLLRAYGKTFELPASLPASVVVDVMRMQAEKDADEEITVKEAVGLLERVLPGAVLEELLARGDFSTDDFSQLVRLVMGAYAGDLGKPGEALAPSRAARRAKAPVRSRSRGSHGTSPPAPSAKAKKAEPGCKSSNTGT